MRKRRIFKKLLFATVLLFAMELGYASFTGNSDDSKNKFSLKNLHTGTRVYSLSTLKTGTFRYKGSTDVVQINNGNQLQIESMVRLEKGNTTYVYPYKYSVKSPKFKTPEAPKFR